MKSEGRKKWEEQRAKEKADWENRFAEWHRKRGTGKQEEKPAAKASKPKASEPVAKPRQQRVGAIMKNPYYTPTKQSSYGETIGRFTNALLGQLFQ